jgi:LysR family hydrogen peroxide-inducible transcriptional activator
MDLRQLRYFLAVAEAESISRAAEHCRVAQPSLSQQIRKLEHALDVRLFDRHRHGVTLTDAGRALLPRARLILAEVHDVESKLRVDIDAGRGHLSVGAIPTMAPYLLPDLIGSLRDEFPECEFTIREDLTEHLIDAVVGHEIDVAIVSTPIDHDLIDLDIVGREELLVVLPAEHRLCSAGAIALPELRDEPTITLHEMHCLGRQITGFCTSRRLARTVVCRSAQLATVLEFVRLGLGVSLVPAMAAANDDSPDRRYLRLKRSPPMRDIALAWRTGRTRPIVGQRLAELLAEKLKADG